MRTFLLRAKKAPTAANFDVKNTYPAGRLDVVCNTVVNCISVSKHLREDVIVHLIFEGSPRPPVHITIQSGRLKGVSPDEASIARMIYDVLKGIEVEGVSLEKKSFEALLKELTKDNIIFYLHPKGDDIRNIGESIKNGVFVLGDYDGIPKMSERFLANLGARRLSLGKTMLYSSHCVVIVNYEIDRL